MKSLECIIFDVEHGFCAFIKSPNNYGLLIDVGSKQQFSPVKFIRKKYANKLIYYKGKRIAKLIVTHLHADHFSDVGSLERYESPKILLRDKKTLKFIEKKIKEAKPEDTKIEILKKFKKFQDKFTEEVSAPPNWGFDYFESKQLTYNQAENCSNNNIEKIINNRSIITVIEYAGKRLLFPGDIEVEGWKEILSKETFKQHLQKINFFIASHHGHKTGFCTDIINVTGKPDLFIVSAKSGDDYIDTSYSKKEYCKGYFLKGEKDKSYMISTRQKKKSIKITIYENGTAEVEFIEIRDNLNRNQAKIRNRKTTRITKKMY